MASFHTSNRFAPLSGALEKEEEGAATTTAAEKNHEPAGPSKIKPLEPIKQRTCPRCGKVYASFNAMRRHFRQKHISSSTTTTANNTTASTTTNSTPKYQCQVLNATQLEDDVCKKTLISKKATSERGRNIKVVMNGTTFKVYVPSKVIRRSRRGGFVIKFSKKGSRTTKERPRHRVCFKVTMDREDRKVCRKELQCRGSMDKRPRQLLTSFYALSRRSRERRSRPAGRLISEDQYGRKRRSNKNGKGRKKRRIRHKQGLRYLKRTNLKHMKSTRKAPRSAPSDCDLAECDDWRPNLAVKIVDRDVIVNFTPNCLATEMELTLQTDKYTIAESHMLSSRNTSFTFKDVGGGKFRAAIRPRGGLCSLADEFASDLFIIPEAETPKKTVCTNWHPIVNASIEELTKGGAKVIVRYEHEGVRLRADSVEVILERKPHKREAQAKVNSSEKYVVFKNIAPGTYLALVRAEGCKDCADYEYEGADCVPIFTHSDLFTIPSNSDLPKPLQPNTPRTSEERTRPAITGTPKPSESPFPTNPGHSQGLETNVIHILVAVTAVLVVIVVAITCSCIRAIRRKPQDTEAPNDEAAVPLNPPSYIERDPPDYDRMGGQPGHQYYALEDDSHQTQVKPPYPADDNEQTSPKHRPSLGNDSDHTPPKYAHPPQNDNDQTSQKYLYSPCSQAVKLDNFLTTKNIFVVSIKEDCNKKLELFLSTVCELLDQLPVVQVARDVLCRTENERDVLGWADSVLNKEHTTVVVVLSPNFLTTCKSYKGSRTLEKTAPTAYNDIAPHVLEKMAGENFQRVIFLSRGMENWHDDLHELENLYPTHSFSEASSASQRLSTSFLLPEGSRTEIDILSNISPRNSSCSLENTFTHSSSCSCSADSTNCRTHAADNTHSCRPQTASCVTMDNTGCGQSTTSSSIPEDNAEYRHISTSCSSNCNVCYRQNTASCSATDNNTQYAACSVSSPFPKDTSRGHNHEYCCHSLSLKREVCSSSPSTTPPAQTSSPPVFSDSCPCSAITVSQNQLSCVACHLCRRYIALDTKENVKALLELFCRDEKLNQSILDSEAARLLVSGFPVKDDDHSAGTESFCTLNTEGSDSVFTTESQNSRFAFDDAQCEPKIVVESVNAAEHVPPGEPMPEGPCMVEPLKIADGRQPVEHSESNENLRMEDSDASVRLTDSELLDANLR